MKNLSTAEPPSTSSSLPMASQACFHGLEPEFSPRRRFLITGDKYLPEFRHGDTVQIDDDVELSPGRYVVFFSLSMDEHGVGRIDERGHVVGYPGGEFLNQGDLYIVGVVVWKSTPLFPDEVDV